MTKFNASILEYLGKYQGGIMVLISIIYDNDYYEATYFYDDEYLLFTPQEELEQKLGYPIQDDPEYADMIRDIIKKVVPYKEMYNRIDELDFEKYNEENIPDETENESKEIDPSEIKKGTD